MTSDTAEKNCLKSAPPPTEALVLMVVLYTLSIYFLPSTEDLDSKATPEIFVRRLYPETLSVQALAIIRLLFGAFCWSVTISSILYGKATIKSTYRPKSKLLDTDFILTGKFFLYPFTSWCWMILGINFLLSGYITLCIDSNQTVSPLLLRTSLMLWQTSAPFTLLVAAVVKYALWPAAIKSSGNGGVLMKTRPLLQHNANVVMALAELLLLGGLPVYIRHISLSFVWGISYTFFSWATMTHWNEQNGKGPGTLYFFMDTTLGRTHTLALLCLLVTLMLFYAIFAGIEFLAGAIGEGFFAHLALLVVLCLLTCRVRD